MPVHQIEGSSEAAEKQREQWERIRSRDDGYFPSWFKRLLIGTILGLIGTIFAGTVTITWWASSISTKLDNMSSARTADALIIAAVQSRLTEFEKFKEVSSERLSQFDKSVEMLRRTDDDARHDIASIDDLLKTVHEHQIFNEQRITTLEGAKK